MGECKETSDETLDEIFDNNDSNTHPDFFKMKNHEYYIPTGVGPILEDYEIQQGNIR